MDRRRFALLEALKAGSLEGGEMRLYRRGKLPGLFAHRTRASAELAQEAIAHGLLEITRVETVGKTAIEWVRVTPKGLDVLLENESPARALEELRDTLTLNQQGLPLWAAQMHQRIDELAKNFNSEVEMMRRQLEQLSSRVVEAIERLEASRAVAPSPSWAEESLEYLERRQQVGLGKRCSLGDLFLSLKDKHADLTIKDFHAGLKRLHDDGTIALLPSVNVGDAPGPEYALLDGPAVFYYVERKAA